MRRNMISAEIEPIPNQVNQAASALQRLGFRILHIGPTISVQGPQSLWESTFHVSFEPRKKTVLPEVEGREDENEMQLRENRVYFSRRPCHPKPAGRCSPPMPSLDLTTSNNSPLPLDAGSRRQPFSNPWASGCSTSGPSPSAGMDRASSGSRSLARGLSGGANLSVRRIRRSER